MSADTDIIVKAALGAGLVCGFFFCGAIVLYFFHIECRPRPRIRRLHRRPIYPIWSLRYSNSSKRRMRTLTESEIEAMFPAQSYGVERAVVACSVCLDDVGYGQLVRLFECGHRFHIQCIDPWLTTHTSCPTCRKQVVLPTDES